MKNKEDRIYIVNCNFRRGKNDDDYCMIPYSYDIVYAMKYAEERDIPKSLVIAMTPDAFDNLRSKTADNTDYYEIFEVDMVGNNVYHVVESELDWLDTVVDEFCTDVTNELLSLHKKLKYFNNKDLNKLRDLLKKVIKKDDKFKYEMINFLNDNLNMNKVFDRIIIKEKGEL